MSTQKTLKTFNFKRYIRRLLKDIDVAVSTTVMNELNTFIHQVCDYLIPKTVEITDSKTKKTVSSSDLEDAITLYLPGKLEKHANKEGVKAVSRYRNSRREGGEIGERRRLADIVGLHIQPPIIWGMIKMEANKKAVQAVSGYVNIYLTAVIEYLLIEILKLSRNVCKESGKSRISSKHIESAVSNDQELKLLFKLLTDMRAK